MMDFNIDYVLGHLPKKGARTSRTIETYIINLIQPIDQIIKRTNRVSVSQAFVKLSMAVKPKVSKFSVVERLVNHRLRNAFYDLLQGSLKNKSITKANKFIEYPIAMLRRVLANKEISSKQRAIKILLENKLRCEQRQQRSVRMAVVMKEYIRRNVTSTLYRNLNSLARKSLQYSAHLGSFEYLFQTIRVKKLFEAFTCISIKTITKNLAQLEKQKGLKRDQARLTQIKRSEVINELKRKVTNAVGQLNEAQINNNRRRVNGSRQNGTKLMKLNEEMRIMEIQTEDLEHKVNSMKNQINRKEYYLSSRQSNEAPFQLINELYHFIASLPQQVPTDLILNKLQSGTIALPSFQQGLNFTVMENIKLKQLINLYEKIGETKKTESYINSNNQNQNLKMLINSILKLHLMNQHTSEMLQVASEVQAMTTGFLDKRINIRQQA